MINNPFIDFHSHRLPSQSDNSIITVFSHYQLDKEVKITTPHFFCAGAHPWFLPTDLDSTLVTLDQLSQQERFIAIGEIGLDRVRGENLEVQKTFFEAQIELALKINSPAIIIHCVRAFDLLLSTLKTTQYKGAFIFHDYAGNTQITEKLLQNPQVYFCLGALLMREEPTSITSLIPLERVFLETDDSNHTIENIYDRYSELTQTSLAILKKQIHRNFASLFPEQKPQEELNT